MTGNLTSRMMVPVAILSLLLIILAIGSAWYVRDLQRSVSEDMVSNFRSMQAAQELEISIREVRTQFDRYLITLDEIHLKSITQLKRRTSDALIEAESTANTPQEQILMKRTRQGYDHFFHEYDRILSDRENWKYAKIIELTDAVLQKEILDPAHEYLQVNEALLESTTQTNQQLAQRITTGMVALGLFGALGGLLGGTVISVAIRRSIQRTEAQVRLTAEQLDEAAYRGQTALESSGKHKDALRQMSQSASAILNRLRQTERDALRAEQLAWVGQMAAGIAHEIRNPLMSIKLLVQATTERRAGGFKARDLQVLEEEIIRLEQIVSGFLDFARPPKLVPQSVDLLDLIRKTINGIRARAELQDVIIHLDVESGPTILTADPNQIQQVLFNLLFNALDAQPYGGEIRIAVEQEGGASPALSVKVQDSGPGIPKELGQRVFEPFVSTKETGVGLGLSICRRIVETHGGTLQYETTPAGTTFVLRLLRQPQATLRAPTSLI